jgi:hypothetical protein
LFTLRFDNVHSALTWRQAEKCACARLAGAKPSRCDASKTTDTEHFSIEAIMIVAEDSALSNSYAVAVDHRIAPPTVRKNPSHHHMPLAGIAGPIVGAAIALAPQASAGQDDDFLALLAQAGVPAQDNIPSVIDYGHQVCAALEGGEPASEVVDTMANYSYNEDPSHDLGQYQRTMVRFVRVAVTAFCPGAGGNLASASRSSDVHRVVLAGMTIPNPPLIPPQPDPVMKLPAPAVATPIPAPKQAPPPQKVPPPPPKVVEPPAVGPQPGAGTGGSDGSAGGHSGSDNGDGVPGPPAPRHPEGHIALAP